MGRPGRPRKKEIDKINVAKLIEETGGKQQAAVHMLGANIPKEDIAKKLSIDPRLLDEWGEIVKDLDEEDVDEPKKPVVEEHFESPRDTWSLDRVQAILKNRGLGRDDLAGEIVRQEAQIRRLENIIANKGKLVDGGSEMGEGLFGADDLKFMREMMQTSMKMAMQKKLMNSMIGESDIGGSPINKRLMERLEKLEKKDEVERMLGPIRDQLESLTKLSNQSGGDISPAMKAQMDSLKETINKYDMEKKQHEMLNEFTKATQKSEDPLKVMREMEEMRSKYAEEARRLEMQVQQQRDENMRMLLERALGDMARKIGDIESRGSGGYNANDIRSLSETVKTIREVSKELGGDSNEKTSLSDKLIENTVSSLGQSVPKFLDVYKDMKKNPQPDPYLNPQSYHPEPQQPEPIMLSQEEVDEIYRRRTEKEKKTEPVAPPKVVPKKTEKYTPENMSKSLIEKPPETFPEPSQEVELEVESKDSLFTPSDTNYEKIKKEKEQQIEHPKIEPQLPQPTIDEVDKPLQPPEAETYVSPTPEDIPEFPTPYSNPSPEPHVEPSPEPTKPPVPKPLPQTKVPEKKN